MDHIQKLKDCARTELLPAEERLLLSTLSEPERRRLEELLRRWSAAERGWPPGREAIRACLDRFDRVGAE